VRISRGDLNKLLSFLRKADGVSVKVSIKRSQASPKEYEVVEGDVEEFKEFAVVRKADVVVLGKEDKEILLLAFPRTVPEGRYDWNSLYLAVNKGMLLRLKAVFEVGKRREPPVSLSKIKLIKEEEGEHEGGEEQRAERNSL